MTSEQLTRFRVIGLHGSHTMDVPITNNKLVLVGENGTGKSTFVNLIYYFLTKQWARLAEYRFERIHAYFGGQELVITPEHIEEHTAARHHLEPFARHLSPRSSQAMFHYFGDLLMQDVQADFTEERAAEFIEKAAGDLGMPTRIVRQVWTDYLKQTKGKPTHIQTLNRRVGELVGGQFLYLPTYRRIEQDLRSIFRGVEIENELRKFRERLTRRQGVPFIELVEFGMEDVEKTIATRMAQIKEAVRNGLDSLTGTYLREVIRGVHTAVDVQAVGEIDPSALDAVFARIDEATLPTSDKALLKEKVATISATKTIDEQDKVIAHFLSKLIEFYTEQQASEKNVRDFVSLCNRYLTGKQLVYDNTRYTIFIARDSDGTKSTDILEMKSLSSGEKQIVSLFSHLYLSGEHQFFVVIDEPELSLSVPWQRRFLPDIVGTGMCTGLIAVTHSPFVWENELEPHVRSLAEFTSAESHNS